jgi:hypothetical protein
MIGGVSQDDRKQFVARNANHLRGDIVRAQGDYLTTMTSLFGCEKTSLDQVFLRLQQNVTKVYGPNLKNGPAKVASEIDLLMESDVKLKMYCSLSA